MFRPKTRHQPVPRGAASGDQGTRGRCPQLPLRRSSRRSTSFPSFEDWRQQGTADLDVAPSYSRGRIETSRTGPTAQPDFACSAPDETKKHELTFGLHGGMDEFRRLKVMYPTVPNCLPSRTCRIPGFCQGGVSASGRWAWQRGPW